MKHLVHHPKTLEGLQFWSQGKHIVLAEFFFWNSGTQLQKSHEGLLRSILHSIFMQAPNTLSTVCSRRRKFKAQPEWNDRELAQVLSDLVSAKVDSTAFCIFIDGLDEYHGNQKDLVSLAKTLAMCRNVKICLSSRPENLFVKDIGNDPLCDGSMALHELTHEDIETYVHQTLHNDERYITLKSSSSGCVDLERAVVERARGVFLWVHLVVDSLIEDFVHDDTLEDSNKRLETLPTDLMDYFRHMLSSIEPVYREEAARIYKTFRLESRLDPTEDRIETLACFEQDGNFALLPAFSLRAPRSQHLDHRYAIVNARINARCRSLLVISSRDDGSQLWISFAHRTVKDFLDTPEALAFLDAQLQKPFDARQYLCNAHLIIFRQGLKAGWGEDASGFFARLHAVVQHHFPIPPVGFDLLWHSLEQDLTMQSGLPDELVGPRRQSLIEVTWGGASNLLNLVAITSEILPVVKTRFAETPAAELPLSATMTGRLCEDLNLQQRDCLSLSRLKNRSNYICLSTAHYFLERGADPNAKHAKRYSPWVRLLREIVTDLFVRDLGGRLEVLEAGRKDQEAKRDDASLDALELFLHHGADPYATTGFLGGEHYSSDEVVRSRFEGWDLEPTDRDVMIRNSKVEGRKKSMFEDVVAPDNWDRWDFTLADVCLMICRIRPHRKTSLFHLVSERRRIGAASTVLRSAQSSRKQLIGWTGRLLRTQ